MSGIWMQAGSFLASLDEYVGIRSGLAIDEKRFEQWMGEVQLGPELLAVPREKVVRLRPEEYEAMAEYLLYKVGNIPIPRIPPTGIATFKRIQQQSPDEMPLFIKVVEMFINHQKSTTKSRTTSSVNAALDMVRLLSQFGAVKAQSTFELDKFCRRVEQALGARASEIARGLTDELAMSRHVSAWSVLKESIWEEIVDLEELFASERLFAQFGWFLDQRFIDFLARNLDDLDAVNWRKFEYLAAEYFARLGFQVVPGPGRNDDGAGEGIIRHGLRRRPSTIS